MTATNPHTMSHLASLAFGPWAVLPEVFDELRAIYARHAAGESADIPAIEAKLGRQLDNEQRRYTIADGGVALVPVQGVIAPKLNMLQAISGGASAQLAMRDVQAAAADPAVRSILLEVDSPGGSVLGIHDLTMAVRAAAAGKPLVTHSDGMLASAAYHFGSAANAIYIAEPAVTVGSIGVIAMHRDASAAKAKAGITDTEITAGRYKNTLSSNAPLSKQGRAFLQEMVDDAYSRFVDAVATNRGVSAQEVLDRMADGRVFIGQQSIDAGLVEGFASRDALIEQMATDPAKFAKRSVARIKPLNPKPTREGGASGASSKPAKGASMDDTTQEGATAQAPLTAEALKKDYPQLCAALRAEGAVAERERVTAVRAQSLPGHEALIEQLAADGKTTGSEAAMAVLAAHRNELSAAAAAHRADAPPAASSTPAPQDGAPSKEEQVAKARAHSKEHGVSFVESLKALGFAN